MPHASAVQEFASAAWDEIDTLDLEDDAVRPVVPGLSSGSGLVCLPQVGGRAAEAWERERACAFGFVFAA